MTKATDSFQKIATLKLIQGPHVPAFVITLAPANKKTWLTIFWSSGTGGRIA